MTKPQPRILIIGAQHGDERLGPRLQRFLRKAGQRYAAVDYVCGNPKAVRRNTRYIESDLNRSYGRTSPATYEERRAHKLLSAIRHGSYDVVLDIHTSTADVDRFFLTTQLNGPTRRIIAASCIERVAIMPPHIASGSLIGQVPHAISIEYNRQLARTAAALKELQALLDNLLLGKTAPRQRDIYYVADAIAQSVPMRTEHRNFVKCEHGFYPILFGEATYRHYQGFAAYHKHTLRL